MKRRNNMMHRGLCLMLATVMMVASCTTSAVPAKKVNGSSYVVWVDNLDFVDVRGSEKPLGILIWQALAEGVRRTLSLQRAQS